MPMKLAAALVVMTLIPSAAVAADFVTISLESPINASAEAAWTRIKGFCEIGAWVKTPCEITSGTDGEVGVVRRIANRIDEVMVARTPSSYTYSQPKSPIDYHGTVEIRPIDTGHARLLYTLVYDADALPKHAPADKAVDRDTRTKQFTAVMAAMKIMAEGSKE